MFNKLTSKTYRLRVIGEFTKGSRVAKTTFLAKSVQIEGKKMIFFSA